MNYTSKKRMSRSNRDKALQRLLKELDYVHQKTMHLPGHTDIYMAVVRLQVALEAK